MHRQRRQRRMTMYDGVWRHLTAFDGIWRRLTAFATAFDGVWRCWQRMTAWTAYDGVCNSTRRRLVALVVGVVPPHNQSRHTPPAPLQTPSYAVHAVIRSAAYDSVWRRLTALVVGETFWGAFSRYSTCFRNQNPTKLQHRSHLENQIHMKNIPLGKSLSYYKNGVFKNSLRTHASMWVGF